MSEQQPALPGMPVSPAPRTPTAASTDGRRVSRYSAKVRKLCDACVFLIHRYGQGGAPYPKAARWRVATADKTRYLCEHHKETKFHA